MTTEPPAAAGRWWLVDRRVAGGAAEGFRAIAPGAERVVGVERVAAEGSSDAAFAERFRASARIAAGLVHERALRVEGVARDGAHLVLVTELPDGRDLGRVLRRLADAGQRMPPAFVAWVGVEACRALHHLHTRTDDAGAPLGLVHGALAPSALRLAFEGGVKLAPPVSAWSAPGDLGYLAPERHAGAPADARADVWSLGVVLHEALTGRRAFPGDDVDVLVATKRGAHLRRPSAVAAGIPEALSSVVTGALRPDPAERYASARAFGEALRAAALVDVRPDVLREALASWLRDLFGEELAADRERVVAARAAHDAALLRAAEAGAASRRRRLGGMLAVGVAGALVLAVAVSPVGVASPEVPAVTISATGTLRVDAPAGARVLVDGTPRGEGRVIVDGLVPGEHEVRVEEGSVAPRVGTVVVVRGGRTHFAPPVP